MSWKYWFHAEPQIRRDQDDDLLAEEPYAHVPEKVCEREEIERKPKAQQMIMSKWGNDTKTRPNAISTTSWGRTHALTLKKNAS